MPLSFWVFLMVYLFIYLTLVPHVVTQQIVFFIIWKFYNYICGNSIASYWFPWKKTIWIKIMLASELSKMVAMVLIYCFCFLMINQAKYKVNIYWDIVINLFFLPTYAYSPTNRSLVLPYFCLLWYNRVLGSVSDSDSIHLLIIRLRIKVHLKQRGVDQRQLQRGLGEGGFAPYGLKVRPYKTMFLFCHFVYVTS